LLFEVSIVLKLWHVQYCSAALKDGHALDSQDAAVYLKRNRLYEN